MLTARVRATRDVHSDTADLGETGVVERSADVGREPAGLRDGEVAGVGARARDHVTGELGAGLGHVELDEAVVERAELVLTKPAEHEVLPVRDPDLGVELALDVGERTELVARDVAEPAVGVGAHRAVGAPAHDVGKVPLVVGIEALQLDGHTVGRDVAHAGGGVAVLLDGLRQPARIGGRRDQELALLEDALAQLVDAHRVDEPLQAGPQLVVTVAVVVLYPQDRLDRGQQVLRGS